MLVALSAVRHRAGVLLSVAALALGAACSDSDSGTGPRDPGAGEWVDLGNLPIVDAVSGIAVFREHVYVGTSRGVYRRPLDGSGAWQQAGLAGLEVKALRAVSAPVPTLYAVGYPRFQAELPFARTTDWTNWTPGGDALRSGSTGLRLGLADLAIQPAGQAGAPPVLYATASGTNIARSTDDGQTWTFVVGQPEEMATYDCLLHVFGASLYQGCEAPLDIAWVRRYDIADRATPSLGDGTVVIDDIDNRRINSFATFPMQPVAQTLFVGLEGAVVALEPDGSWRWLFRVEPDGSAPYTYVKSIWVDPADPEHIVFGGGEEQYAEDRSGLHETFDGGETSTVVTGPAGIDFAKAGIPAGMPIGPDGRDLLLVVDLGHTRRVLIRRAAAED